MNLHTCEQTNGILDSRDTGNRHRTTSVLFTELATTGIPCNIIQYTSKCLALIVRAILLRYKEKRHAPLFQHDFLASETLSESAQSYDLHQFFTLMRHSTETIYQSRTIGCHLLISLQAVEFTIE